MRFGVISTTKGLPWAAPDEVWSRFAALALERGHEVVATVDRAVHASGRLRSLQAMGLRIVVRRPFRPTKLYLLKERFFSELHAFEAFAPEVVLFNGGSILDAGHQPNLALFCSRFRGRLVFVCHGHSEEYAIPDRAGLRDFLGGTAGVVFVAEENRRTVEAQLAFALPRSWVIPNAPSFLLDDPLPWPDPSAARFACVARLDAHWKGHDVLLRALAQPGWSARDWSLDLYGRGGDESHIRELARHFGFGERVRMHGHVDDILPVWQNAHVCLLASRAESLSLAVLEAMMCGRPVVTTDVGDHRRVVEDGVTGFVAEAATAFSFGRALERAWAARERWRDIGQAAHATAVKLHAAAPAERLLQCALEAGLR
jgi:glycosyltransferase involved in cell wall biosynthesis